MNNQGFSSKTFSFKTFLSVAKQRCYEGGQVFVYSLLFSHVSFIPYAHAGPTDGQVVGGAGSITQSGLTTTINQSSSSMAIDWGSYNVNSNERVQYNMDVSAISLNNILSHSGSEIHGRIDAAGTVILVNPNGVFFGPTSQINVGGLIASGLRISPTDFMNGDYIFNEVLGTDGTVVNSGVINASLGGNVALIGKQVKNEGVINAKLGAVNMAAGKQAVLTFDNQGLLGVRISKEILQDELGIDPAVLNSGEINAEGGRVLLTASVSRDVFSQAVNTGELEPASSVLVNDDGSFSLGGGADVVNSGSIDVSTIDVSTAGENTQAGDVIIIGENITHTGVILADTNNSNESAVAGNIELHANDTVELKDNAIISARAETAGTGGKVKVLGNKVGLLDSSVIDVSGANGGGEVLVGGDRQGLNENVRNAEFLYMSEDAKVFADALDKGNGGRIITYADDTGRFYGGLYARGGANGGDGGFIETSGKQGFEILNAPDVSASNGEGGLWLIDPYNITIQASGDPLTYNKDDTTSPPDTIYTSIASALTSTIDVGVIETALGLGDVEIITDALDGGVAENGDINFTVNLNYDGTGSKTLTLDAAGNISFTSGVQIKDNSPGADSLNINLFAAGSVLLSTGVVIETQGGNFTVGDATGVNSTPTSFTANGSASIDTTGRGDTAGGNIDITTSGSLTAFTLTANGGSASSNNDGKNAGSITLQATNAILVNGAIQANGSNGNESGGGGNNWIGGNGGNVSITSTNTTVTLASTLSAIGGNAAGSGGGDASGGDAGSIDLIGNVVTLNDDLIATGGTKFGSGIGITDGSDGAVTVALTGTNAEAIINYASDFTSVINVNGTLATSATLVGSDRANTWTISGGNSGVLGLTGNVVFTDVGSLSANSVGTNTDEFILTGTGSLSGSIDGTGGTNTLKGRDDITTWNITTANAGGSTYIGSFSNINEITGGTAKDDFVLSGTGSLSGVIDGGGGTNNSLTGRSDVGGNIWNIDDVDSGDVTNLNAGFIGIQNLIGGSQTDAFNLTTNSSEITGSINGMGGTNTLVGRDDNTTWNITAGNEGNATETAGAANIIASFTNITDITGNASDDDFVLSASGALTGSINGNGGNNSLQGRNDAVNDNDWNITAPDSGTVTNIGGSFSNIKDLIGGTGTDNFELSGLTATLSGSIDGNGGSNTLTARGDVSTDWDIDGVDQGTVANITGGFVDIQHLVGRTMADNFVLSATDSQITGSINGGAGVNTLTGRDSATTWNITAANAGDADDVAAFSNIASLNGGSANDDFVLSGTGSLTGSIDGNGGTNSLQGRNDTTNNWNISTPEGGTVTNITGTFSNIDDLVGGTGDDNFVLLAVSTGSVNSITGNGGTNSLTARDNATNDWSITTTDSGSVNNVGSFSDIQNLIGGAFADNFVLSGTGSVTSIDGKAGTNSLTARDNPTNNWSITAANFGSVNDVQSFSNILNLNGGSGDDNFVLSATGSIGIIDGMGGTNSLTANNTSNIWSITDNNVGTLTNTNGFSNIQDITGGALDDTITFTTASSSIDGLIDGGLGIDSLDIQALTSDVTVQLGVTPDSDVNVDNVETITANAAQDNTIIAETKLNTWTIDGIDTGLIQDTNSPIPESNVRFTNFKTIIGGASSDIFRLDGGSITTLIDGGAGTDSVDYSLLSNITVQIGGALGSVKNAEQVIGNNTITLAAENGFDNTWDITGVNTGTVDNSNMANSLSFVDFMLLQGGDQIDTFNVNGGSANINGGAGDDVLNVNLTGAENGSITFDGAGHDVADTVNLLGGATANYEGQYNSNVTVNNHDQFVYSNDANVFDVKYINTESVQDDLTANTLTINGTAGVDTIDLNTQVFTVNTATTVNYSSANKSNLTVDGQASNDTINISGDISIGNRVTLSAETINNTTASTITANELLISNAVNAGSNVNRLLTDVNDIYVTNSASVYVQNANALNIAQLVNTILLDVISTTGDITDGVALVSTGELKLKADAGSIVLDDNNQLSGPLSLVASGDVTLNNTTSTDLALVTAQNLTVTSTGQVTDSGVITVAGDTTLNSASDITLDSANDFNNLTVTGATNLLINDINNLNVVAIDVNGLADVRANNLSLDRINAATVKLDAGLGQITDSNGINTNITASSIVMRANTGIGSSDAIETSTAELDVINNGAGGGIVEIVNTGNVLLTKLVNNGDINFRNDTNVTIDNIDAGFTVGTLQFDVTNGSVFGVDRGGNYLAVPDITADRAIVSVSSEFGTFNRPIVLKLNTELFLASTVSSTVFFDGQPPPINNDTSDLQISILDSANSVSGQQLIEIESIADIDPAIFTELHNYSKEDISIRMPRDQMFEDDLENLSRL